MPSIDFLTRRVSELEQEYQEAQQALQEVLEKIEIADKKRLQEADARGASKWNRILDTLENSLDLAKARVTRCEAELKDKRQKLKEELEKPVAAEPVAEAEPQGEEKWGGEGLAQEVLAMSADELASLSFEDIARLQQQEMAAAAAVAQGKSAAEAEAEKRKVYSPEERRKVRLLQMAIQKVVDGEIDTVAVSELDMLVKCFDARLKSGGEKDKIFWSLDAGLRTLAGRCVKFLEQWRDLESGQ